MQALQQRVPGARSQPVSYTQVSEAIGVDEALQREHAVCEKQRAGSELPSPNSVQVPRFNFSRFFSWRERGRRGGRLTYVFNNMANNIKRQNVPYISPLCPYRFALYPSPRCCVLWKADLCGLASAKPPCPVGCIWDHTEGGEGK